jgi:hypothetical protein
MSDETLFVSNGIVGEIRPVMLDPSYVEPRPLNRP